MKNPTMWCVRRPNGKLLVGTLAKTKDLALWNLFDEMPEKFRSKFWKKLKESRRAYKKLGYTVVKVTIFPTAELVKLLEATSAPFQPYG
jgi:hypothetical protein